MYFFLFNVIMINIIKYKLFQFKKYNIFIFYLFKY